MTKLLLLLPFLFTIPCHSFIYKASAMEDGGNANAIIGERPKRVAPPVLSKIAFCESSNNPKAVSKTSSARGLYQIIISTEELVERNTGKDYDAFNPQDNLEMAEWLLERYGTKPWKSSEWCWNT